MKRYSYLIFVLLILFVTACGERKADKITTLNFQEDLPLVSTDSIDWKFIKLETNDSCLFYGIRQIEFVQDKIIILDNAYERVLLFNNQGKFIKQIGMRGSGPREYILPGKLLIDSENNLLEIVDFRTRKILSYSLENYQFVKYGYINQDNYSDCIWLDNQMIVWFNIVGYTDLKRGVYSLEITDGDFKHQRYLVPTQFHSAYSINSGSSFYQYNKQTFFIAPFSDLVFEVRKDTVRPVYRVTFGNESLPPAEWWSEHLKGGNNYVNELLRSPYVSAYNLLETGNFFGTTFYGKDRSFRIAFLNKSTGRSCQYKAFDFMRAYDLYGMSNILGTYQDYFIVSLYMDSWKDRPIVRKDLQDLHRQSTEFDNPVICLFKFK